VEAYDLAHKLAFTGRHSPVPFTTGPEYTNSVPGVPVLSMLRIFILPEHWSRENVKTVAREVARVLGPGEQFDIGITLAEHAYDPNTPATGMIARLMKLNPNDPHVTLLIKEGLEDQVFRARYPRLQWEEHGEDFWQSIYAPATVKPSSLP
jgi:hypothetical protein